MADTPYDPCHGKTSYPSKQVAENAAELHRFIAPGCGGYDAYRCEGSDDDHWHVGHPTRTVGDLCKDAHQSERWYHGVPDNWARSRQAVRYNRGKPTPVPRRKKGRRAS